VAILVVQYRSLITCGAPNVLRGTVCSAFRAVAPNSLSSGGETRAPTTPPVAATLCVYDVNGLLVGGGGELADDVPKGLMLPCALGAWPTGRCGNAAWTGLRVAALSSTETLSRCVVVVLGGSIPKAVVAFS
jgi:hypothetical protein